MSFKDRARAEGDSFSDNPDQFFGFMAGALWAREQEPPEEDRRIEAAPSMERLREAYIYECDGDGVGSIAAGAAFDRAIAVHDKRIRADVDNEMVEALTEERDYFREHAGRWQQADARSLEKLRAAELDLERRVTAARAEALRDAVEKYAITIPDVLGYKVRAVAVEDLLNQADAEESR